VATFATAEACGGGDDDDGTWYDNVHSWFLFICLCRQMGFWWIFYMKL